MNGFDQCESHNGLDIEITVQRTHLSQDNNDINIYVFLFTIVSLVILILIFIF